VIRRFSTSILTPGPDEGAFPSDLLSRKTLATSERTIGMKGNLKHLVPEYNCASVFLTLIFISERRESQSTAMHEFQCGLDYEIIFVVYFV